MCDVVVSVCVCVCWESTYVSEGPAASIFKVKPKYVCNRYPPDADDCRTLWHHAVLPPAEDRVFM